MGIDADRPVIRDLPVPDSDDRVVLFEYGAGAGPDENLVRIDPRGTLRCVRNFLSGMPPTRTSMLAGREAP